MARPDDPHARRRARTLTALLALTALALLSLDTRFGAGSPLDGARSAVADALGPVERGATHLTTPLRALAGRPDATRADAADVEEVRAEVARPTAADRTSGLTATRSAELDALLGIAGAAGYETLPALVVAVAPPQAAERTVTIDVGEIDGVTPGLTVVNGDGVVGRVLSVARTTATVQLVIDADAAVGVRLDGSQQLGVAHGAGTDLSLALFDPYAATRAGDRVVTFGGTDISGAAGTYVGGLPLGTITAVHGALGSLDRTATVRPYVDATTLDLVGVLLTSPRTTPRAPVTPSGDVP